MQPANQLIARLPRRERERLLAQGEPFELEFGAILCEADEPLAHAHFPVEGFISLVVVLPDHPPLEMGLIGDEGMLGSNLVLGVASSAMRAVVQGAGTSLRIPAQALRLLLVDSPELARGLMHYVHAITAQLAHTAACTHFHEIEPRLARWLLMTQDRAHSDHFHLTHELLADMLGVRRSGVTIAAGALQQRNLIRYSRGEISILDRPGLEAASCRCYGDLIDDYARTMGLKASASRPARRAAMLAARIRPTVRDTQPAPDAPGDR